MSYIYIILSLIGSIVIIFKAIVGNPGASEVRDMTLVQLFIPALMIVGVLGWPWLLAFFAAKKQNTELQITVFSILSIVIAILISPEIRSSPSEGIGVVVILYGVAIWVSYPVTLIFRHIKLH